MNKRGFTLTEILVTLVAGFVIISAAVSFLLTSTRMLTENELRQETVQEFRIVKRHLQRDVRAAGYGGAVNAIEVEGDTLTVRFLETLTDTAQVTYIYDDAQNSLFRVETGLTPRRNRIGSNIQAFQPYVNTDTDGDTISVSFDLSFRKENWKTGVVMSLFVSPRNLNLN